MEMAVLGKTRRRREKGSLAIKNRILQKLQVRRHLDNSNINDDGQDVFVPADSLCAD